MQYPPRMQKTLFRPSFMAILVILLFQGSLSAQESGSSSPGITTGEPSHPECGGVERWAVKVLTDPDASQVNFTPVFTTIDSLVHIPTNPSSTAPRVQGIEFQTYRIKCRITIKKNEDDNDYHLVLQDSTQTMVGEVPDPVCSAAASSAHVDEYLAARRWVLFNIGYNPNPIVNLPYVYVTGVAFVDVFHGQTGASPNQMEIHPILNIQFVSNVGINEPGEGTALLEATVSPSVFSQSTLFHIVAGRDLFENCRLEIFSMTGNKVKDLALPVTGKKEITYTFRRDHLPGGVYIYRIRNNGSILYEGKMIVE
jgi:hypothetical protein